MYSVGKSRTWHYWHPDCAKACSIGRWRWWRCLIRNWTHNGQFGKLLQQLLLGMMEMRRNMRESSWARIVNISFISMHIYALPVAAIRVFPAKTPWKEKYMKILVVDWLLWGLCMKISSQTPITWNISCSLHITNILKINTAANEIWQNMSKRVPKKVMPLSVYGDKTDSLHFWPLDDLSVTVYV